MRELTDILMGPGHASEGGAGERARRRELLLRGVIDGLSGPVKQLDGIGILDARDGRSMELIDAIATTGDYYLTRTEMELLRVHADSISDLIGEGAHLVELGSSNSLKVRILLSSLRLPLSYTPIEQSSPRLWSQAMQMQLDHPYLAVRPLSADYTTLATLPKASGMADDAVFMAFGSTLGEFHPIATSQILKRLGLAANQSLLLAGVDLKKDSIILEAAYNDAAGFNAELNRHLLARLNRTLDADFDLAAFQHVVRYNDVVGRVEILLKSKKRQDVKISGQTIHLDRGELIHTRSAYKYTVGQFQRLARRSGYMPLKVWTDPQRLYSLHLLCNSGYLH